MINLIKRFIYVVSCTCVFGNINTMVFDNRYVPLILQPFFANKDAVWDCGVRGIFFGSQKTLNPDISSFSGDEIPLFDINGAYDEIVLDQALQKAKVINQSLLRPDLLAFNSIPWRQNGKLSFQGLVFETFVHLTSYLGIGGSIIGGKMDAHLELELGNVTLAPGDLQEVINVNTQIHQLLGLRPPCYDHGEFGNIDLYLRLHAVREYWHKLHRIDIGANFGFLIPTGQTHTIYNPAFIPLASPYFGIYGAFDATCVLREDLTIGFLLRANKRFARTLITRMPVAGLDNARHEPLNYGVLVGPARITPGWTLIFSPRLEITGLRDGLGFNIAYVLTKHWRDTICDARSSEAIAASAAANTGVMETLSSWGSDYVSVAALYDFGYDKHNAHFAPIVSLIVDIPFKGLVAKRVMKTHGISLRIESRI